VSNKAALALYKDLLGFNMNGIEAKYYADGEDGNMMRKDLKYVKTEKLDAESSDEDDEDENDVQTIGKDEGDQVGSIGEKKIKVKMGRGLGVGALVERNESVK